MRRPRPRLLVIALPDAGHLPDATHLLLAERLVLLAIAETRALECLFWGCPRLAARFSQQAMTGTPALRERSRLTVLGDPFWLRVEGTAWTEHLAPWASLTGWTRQRVRPLDPETAALVGAGLSELIAARVLERYHSLAEAVRAAQDMLSALDKKGTKVKDVTDTFHRRADIQATAQAERSERVEIEPIPTGNLV